VATALGAYALLIACEVFAVPPPKLIRLEQSPPRSRDGLDLPEGACVGPTIPGLLQDAIPQGLAFLEPQRWFLISCDFDDNRPSVLVAIDEKSGAMVRCLTIINKDGSPHTGHVGGLALSGKAVWVGGKAVYEAPLRGIVAAKPFDYLRVSKAFQAECRASYLAFADGRLWVGEFVRHGHEDYGGVKNHRLADRQGGVKHAWACAYELDREDNIVGVKGRKAPSPSAVLATRECVQGMAFIGDHIIVSASYGNAPSSLEVYANPLRQEGAEPHTRRNVGGSEVPIWFLDDENKLGADIECPSRAEGVVAVDDSLAVITESGAKKYVEKGCVPLDSVIIRPLPKTRR
jgi:hypothetical protein